MSVRMIIGVLAWIAVFAELAVFDGSGAFAAETPLPSSAEPIQPGSWHADYQASMGLRNFPLGASATGVFGIGTLLWGEKKPDDFRYGYVRGSAKLRTSGLINRADVSLQVHPISFFGLRAGYALSQRASTGGFSDCSANACLGTIAYPHAAGSLGLGYGGFALSGEVQWGALQPSEQDRPFYDETFSLIGKQGGDHGLCTSLALVYSPSGQKKWLGGLLYTSERMLDAGAAGEFLGAIARYRSGAWAVSGGAGAYASGLYPQGLSVFAQLKWAGGTSLEL